MKGRKAIMPVYCAMCLGELFANSLLFPEWKLSQVEHHTEMKRLTCGEFGVWLLVIILCWYL